MDKNTKVLLSLLLFNTMTAVLGGLALMTEVISEAGPLEHTDFASLYFPGVILMAIVGGSAAIAAIALIKNVVGWQLATVVSAVIMLVWIIGEVASIRMLHFLQLIYLVTAGLIIYLVPKTK